MMAICDPTSWTDVGSRGWGESSEWREKVARLATFPRVFSLTVELVLFQ